MTIAKQYVKYEGIDVPAITGAKGKGGGGKVSPNSLFSTDFLYLTTAIGEGPVYRINPNGPQDVQIQDSSIDDLLNLDSDGSIKTSAFDVRYTTGTVTQGPLFKYGDAIITPQAFASAVPLRYGPPPEGDPQKKYSPKNMISNQETSEYAWDALKFVFNVDSLSKADSSGNVRSYSLTVRITVWNKTHTEIIAQRNLDIRGKTDKPVRRSAIVNIPVNKQSESGYLFDIEKTSLDSIDAKIQDAVSVVAWFEIENKKQAYPRTAVIGYGLKASNEHTGGIPTFTSMIKGLLVKVPSNYNQPILTRVAVEFSKPLAYYERAGEIDWRELEVPVTSSITINGAITTIGYSQRGYTLQKPGVGTVLYDANPQIYVGTWDGTFTYSWTQNPIWIIYDILTNKTYGLGIPEENIDKYKFYQIAQYCDACDPTTGRFVGVAGLADGSYRYKPKGLYNKVRENQRGLPEGTAIRERRFITDISIVDQEKSMDLLNKIAATFRGMLIYSGSKITLAVDMPDEYPVMMFNEATIKQGSFQISGTKESDVYTGIDVNYIDPTNHFKRETVRVNTADANDGTDTSDIENIASLDLYGVTRRSQAVRMAQYQIAASRYQRRNINFTTSSDAINLAPGDVISIASRSSGVAYGYGGKVSLSSNRNLVGYSEDFSVAGWSKTGCTVTANTTTAPDGTLTADTITATTTDPYIEYQVSSTALTYTMSVWLKGFGSSIGKRPGFYLPRDGYAEYKYSGFLSALTSDWQRYTFTTTFSVAPATVNFRCDILETTPTIGDAVYMWGAQLEVGSVLTDYIKTPATAVTLEHFTFPALSNSVFTANTYPLTLRVLSQASDRLETYIISNTNFVTASTSNVSNGIDLATVQVLSRFNKYSKTYEDISATGFTANVAPKAGDLWSLGEIQNPLNYYSDKSSKLFKVTNTKRETSPEEITISAVEYISNVYVDSDTFINYQPTAYLDTPSSFATPPTPDFDIVATPRVKLDGSVVVDGILKTNPQRAGYGTRIETEYYVSTPAATSLIANVTASSPLTLIAANATALTATSGSTQSILTGKNGFTSKIGKVSLLCNAVTTSLGSIAFTVEGLSSCLDMNYYQHILSMSSTLKGNTSVTVPILSKLESTTGQRNFIGYTPPYVDYQANATYAAGTNIITIPDTFIVSDKISDRLPPAPFYLTINQQLNPENYSNNSFYVEGTSYTYLKTGTLNKNAINYIDLDIKPRHSSFVRVYIDGIAATTSSYTVNANKTTNIPANIMYTATNFDSAYRLEVDHYTVPTIEVDDTLEVSAGNVFIVSNTSFDPASAKYNAALTSNSVYRIELVTSPTFSLNGYRFINISTNPVGIVNNVSGSSFTLDYDTTTYPGYFRLANNNIYSVELDSTFNKYFLADDATIPELALGATSVKARNKNTIGRYSPYVQKSVYVSAIPIQRVASIALTESIFIEQTGGASSRITITFPTILNQQVTDYEISYKLVSVDASYVIPDQFKSFNTIKVSASAADTDGNIRYTVNNIPRGTSTETVSIVVMVTPVNRGIRGSSYEVSELIRGKTAKPQNVKSIIASQQGELVVISWDYERIGNTLLDLDLKEVVISRMSGVQEATADNFLKAEKIATASPPTSNKSIPIDNYNTYTYFLATYDTSGNRCDIIAAVVLSTVKAQLFNTIAAYNEDIPSEAFTSIPNTNATEYHFPSFSNSLNGGVSGSSTNKVDNANGSSSGWSIASTDLRAGTNARYVTQIRDLGDIVTGYITFQANSQQEIQATYNDQHVERLDSVSDTFLPGFTYFNNVSIASKELNANDIFFSNTGSYMYVLGATSNANVYQYNLTSAWNVATAIYESNAYIGIRDSDPQGLFFRSDGRKMYFVGSTSDRVYEYDLATPWLANSATHLQNVSIATQDTAPSGLTFSNTGTSMYIAGGATNNIYQYTLSTPWNVSTASYTARANVAPQDTLVSGFTFNTEGTRAYMTGRIGDNVYKYTLSEAWNISTLTYSSNAYVGVRESSPSGLYVNNTESSIYIIGPTQDRVQQFNVSPTAAPNVLIDSDYGGIGYYLGYNNPSIPNPRYDVTNKTWITSDGFGNVWAIWNHGQFVNDTANANTYALIAGLINTNAIALGATYHANGMPTGSNSFANVTNGGSAYTLVDLKQFADVNDITFAGTPNQVTTQTYIRTATSNVYYANGNVNSLAFASSGDGFVPYGGGKRTFRYLQIRYDVVNIDPAAYDFVLDKLRYAVEKEQITYTNTFVFLNSPTTAAMTVDYSGSKFLYTPTVTINARTITDGTSNLVTAVYTAISNSSVSIKLAYTNGSGYYPADGTATIMLTAQGV